MKHCLTSLAMLVLAAACSTDDGGPTIRAVEPSAGDGSPALLTLVGDNFLLGVSISYSDEKDSVIEDAFSATLGGVALTDVTYVDSQHLLATFPGGLPNGTYDLTVVAPSGQTSTLANAYAVGVLLPDGGSSDGGTGPDGSVDPDGPFSTPVRIATIDDANGDATEAFPTATDDLLELYFESNVLTDLTDFGDIYVSTRASTDAPWGAPTRDDTLSSADYDGTPEVLGDGLTMYLTRGLIARDIYVSTRPNRSSPWSAPAPVDELSGAGWESSPTSVDAQTTMVFTSNRMTQNLTNFEMYMVTRASTGDPWGTPAIITELDEPGFDGAGMLRDAERLIFFDSNRTGGSGARDIYRASRADTVSAFGNIFEYTELNSPSNDTHPWVSKDLRHVIFASDRDGASTLYEATR